MKLALVTCDGYDVASAEPGDWYVHNILHEDALLTDALSKYGIHCQRVSWSDERVDWRAFDAAMIRSTWDYFHRFQEFDPWLDRVAQATCLINPLNILRWNIDKHYLRDLERQGLDIVPSIFIEAGSMDRLVDLLESHKLDQAVIKPCISGAARATYRVNRDNAAEIDQTLTNLRAVEAFLLQPFMPSIIEHGEDTLVMAGDTFTHAVRKRAKAGDFRVQDDHGGTVSASEATAEQIAVAERAMQSCHPVPAYGRVDLVRDSVGRWLIMELELIEPELWMRFQPDSAQHVARSVASYMQAQVSQRR